MGKNNTRRAELRESEDIKFNSYEAVKPIPIIRRYYTLERPGIKRQG